MLNDRNDKFEGHDDSEYHFSDEDVSYELETEAQKQSTSSATVTQESLVNRLAEKKRYIISGVVVLALIFVIYKILAPSTPTTDIVAQEQQKAASTLPMMAGTPTNAPTNTTATTVPAQPTYITSTTNQPLPSSAPVVNNNPAMQAASANNGMTANSAMPQPSAVTSMPQQPLAQPQQPVQSSPQQAMSQPYGQSMPNMPVSTSTAPVVQVQNGAYMPPAAPGSSNFGTQLPSAAINSAGNLANESNKLVTQLQSDYVQKLNDFSTQNKALQDQVQTLNSRVSSLEGELSQLIHTLNRQNSPDQTMPTGAAPGQMQQGAEQQKTSLYNVQAIIPGRAWLRAENGETVTVAEGDQIKDLGKVTKIDPYDGVVEVNTGNKVISLAYGNGS